MFGTLEHIFINVENKPLFMFQSLFKFGTLWNTFGTWLKIAIYREYYFYIKNLMYKDYSFSYWYEI